MGPSHASVLRSARSARYGAINLPRRARSGTSTSRPAAIPAPLPTLHSRLSPSPIHRPTMLQPTTTASPARPVIGCRKPSNLLGCRIIYSRRRPNPPSLISKHQIMVRAPTLESPHISQTNSWPYKLGQERNGRVPWRCRQAGWSEGQQGAGVGGWVWFRVARGRHHQFFCRDQCMWRCAGRHNKMRVSGAHSGRVR